MDEFSAPFDEQSSYEVKLTRNIAGWWSAEVFFAGRSIGKTSPREFKWTTKLAAKTIARSHHKPLKKNDKKLTYIIPIDKL